MRNVCQRAGDDCGVAALAAVAGVSYARAFRAFERAGCPPVGDGLNNKDVLAAARKLGLVLLVTRKTDRALSTDGAVMRVRWLKGERARLYRGGHFVAVRRGRVYCPSEPRNSSYTVKDYCARFGACVCSLLERV